MNDFAHVLRRAEARLVAPEPDRSRILLEMAHDLEELYRAYLDRGMSPADAAARAEAVFGASGTVIAELSEVHQPVAARVLARFSSRGRHRLERAILTAVTLCGVAAGVGGVAAAGIAGTPSPWLWSLCAVFAAALWCTSAALLDLFGRPARPITRERVQPMAALAALSVALGVVGVVFEGWRLTRALEFAPVALPAVIPFLRRASELLTLSLSLSLAIGLVWFHLRVRALEVERARAVVHRVTHPTQEGDLS